MDSFENFRGNETSVRTLRQALETKRFPDSLLFAGSEGIGKRTLALMLAKALNCLEVEGSFCNHCASCRKIEAGTHPDVGVVGLLEEKHFLQIDQIRQARKDVFYQPFEGRCRVIIIDEADRMKDDGANSILKMLEEPPPSTKIILLTTKFHSLLPTVRSRCQVFSFSPVPLPLVRQFLEGRSDLTTGDRELCARLARGSIGRALSLDLESYRSLRSEVMELIQASLITHSAEGIVAAADVLGRKKENFEERLDILYLLFQDLFYLIHQAPEEQISNVDLHSSLRTLSKLVPPASIPDVFSKLDAITSGLRFNVNRQIVLEDLAFHLTRITPGSSIPSP
ncbi:MAG: AAA family ATPase [Acidobacteriia bacterium]|nr:AAA family ATPase [Terriglobia bacterium]